MSTLLFSALAGICGTWLGGFVTTMIGNPSKNMTGNLLSFAAPLLAGGVG